MERIEALTNYYTTHDEHTRFDSKHGIVEFLTTVNYIEKYLKKGMDILEIGAGSGRYSHYFARKGYRVTAVELMECNIESFMKNTEEGESVSIMQGDAIDLSSIESESYDITLLLGPMYHLYTEEDQKKALTEAIRVTKKSGVIFVAYCNSDLTMYQYCFGRGMLRSALEQNKINLDTFKLYSLPEDVFVLYRREDIDRLTNNFNVTRLHYVGTDMLTHMMRGAVDALDDKDFEIYMKYHFNICERKDMVGATNHILDIFRKE